MGPVLDVVAALIREGDRLLIAQRLPGKDQALLWEFPGGKLEPGERPEEALAREIDEELGIGIAVGPRFMVTEHATAARLVRLHAFWARATSGSPRALQCHDWRWVTREDLADFAYPPADLPIVEALRNLAAWPE
jgi:mutator protein MutT